MLVSGSEFLICLIKVLNRNHNEAFAETRVAVLLQERLSRICIMRVQFAHISPHFTSHVEVVASLWVHLMQRPCLLSYTTYNGQAPESVDE